jgi:hypothetical protein
MVPLDKQHHGESNGHDGTVGLLWEGFVRTGCPESGRSIKSRVLKTQFQKPTFGRKTLAAAAYTY